MMMFLCSTLFLTDNFSNIRGYENLQDPQELTMVIYHDNLVTSQGCPQYEMLKETDLVSMKYRYEYPKVEVEAQWLRIC